MRRADRDAAKKALDRVLEKSGYNRLKVKHPQLRLNRMPDLSTPSNAPPTSDLSGARGGSTAKRQLPPDAKQFPVGHSHKQGLELITPGSDPQWYGGKKT